MDRLRGNRLGGRTVFHLYRNRSVNVTVIATDYDEWPRYVLKGVYVPLFLKGGTVDDLKPLAEQLEKYVRKLSLQQNSGAEPGAEPHVYSGSVQRQD